MRTDRVIAIFSAAMLAMSCSSNNAADGLQEQAITMNAATQTYSRAAMTSFGTSPSSISLFGRTTLSGQTATLFNNTTLSYTSSPAEGWTYSPTKYWNNQKTYDFTALYPYDADNLTYDEAANRLTYNTSYVSSLDNQTDLMWAAASRNPATEGQGAVNLHFNHTLAAVKILFINASNDSARLTDIHFTGLDDTATTLTIDNGTSQGWQGTSASGATELYSLDEWSHGSVAVNTETSYCVYDTASAPQVSSDGTLLCIPQKIAGTSAALHFKVVSAGTTLSVDFDLANLSEITEWKAGKRYTYTLTLVDNKITFVADVVDWIDTIIDLQ